MLMARVPPSKARKSAAIAGALLCLLGMAWELWLAPLRPGSLLWLKVLPLLLCLPWIWRGSIVMHQWWSMASLLYFTEGVVRATTESGLSQQLASMEVLLSTVMWFAVLTYVAAVRWTVKNRASEASNQPIP
ncbi:MAG: hypothetical protein RL539_319 [Pseudomonadota bacterium]|jgi:uncharacterized membrane protein